jgi:hypothetical protein
MAMGVKPLKDGGPGRDRTDDLFHAMEARSQLRHRPTYLGFSYLGRVRIPHSELDRTKVKGHSLGGIGLRYGLFLMTNRSLATSISKAILWP